MSEPDEPDTQSEPAPPDDVEQGQSRRESAADVARLSRYGAVLAVAGMGAAAAFVALGIDGARPFAHGLALGAIATLLNLRLLAHGAWALLVEHDATRAALYFGGSFFLLVLAAFVVALGFADWTLGFAAGLALPAPAGIWFGLRLRRRDAAGRPARDDDDDDDDDDDESPRAPA